MNKLRKILLGFCVFVMILPLSYAENPSDNLDLFSKIKKGFNDATFTITGQQRGCAAEPSKTIYVNAEDISGSMERITFSYARNNQPGLANTYSINDDGTYNYLNEYEYEYMAERGPLFWSKYDYAVEFYDCEAENDREPYTTPDGYDDGDIVCKNGEFLAEIEFTTEYEYEYDRVATCENGCTSSVCNDPTQDESKQREFQENVGADGDLGEKEDYWDQGEVDQQYSDLIKQLEDEKIQLEKLRDTLDEKNKTESQIAGLEKDIENFEDEKSTNFLPVIFIIVVGVVVIIHRKRIPIIGRYLP